LRRGAASSFIVGFRWRLPHFALPIPPADGTALFAVEALARTSRRGSGITRLRILTLAADLLRPSAEKAEPDEQHL
jgi:hypothetical protein